MKFAHIADAHLGAFSKNRALREFNLRAFELAVEKSIEENVDFIIIAGDLFHNPLPDMSIANSAVSILNRARDAGIRIYVVYGSHDSSAGTTSLLDVLATTGLFQKVVNYRVVEGKLQLIPVEDPTGVRIVGVPGLTSAMEVRYFNEDIIDREFLESIPSPKIFVFHTTVTELKPSYISERKDVPLSKFPRGFDYYAGGHLHERIEYEFNGAPLRYTGALFGSSYTDLERFANLEHGFYIVEDFKPKFVPVKVCDFEVHKVNASGLSASKLEEKLIEIADREHKNRVVILKVYGELKSGKRGDIDFQKIRELILRSASDALINTYALTTAERRKLTVSGSSEDEIENRVFAEISDYGLDFTHSLFHVLKEEKSSEESNDDFKARIWSAASTLIENARRVDRNVEKDVVNKDEGNKNEKSVPRKDLFDFLGDAR